MIRPTVILVFTFILVLTALAQDDTRVSATWQVAEGAVEVHPLRSLTKTERGEVAAEASAVAAFLSDGESDRVRLG